MALFSCLSAHFLLEIEKIHCFLSRFASCQAVGFFTIFGYCRIEIKRFPLPLNTVLERNGMTSSKKYKELSIDEFTRAADKYESKNAGVYNICKKDFPAAVEDYTRALFGTLS